MTPHRAAKLRISEYLLQAIVQEHKSELEKASFLLCHTIKDDSHTVSLLPHVADHYLPEQYNSQGRAHLKLSQEFARTMMWSLMREPVHGANTLVLVHNHPVGPDEFSHTDLLDEIRVINEITHLGANYRPGQELFLLEVLLAPDNVIKGRIRSSKNSLLAVPVEFHVLGSSLRVLQEKQSAPASHAWHESVYDRQKDFLLPEKQKQMADMRVLLAGAGGTGSIMAEGLLRLGFGALHIIDHDLTEITNLNRLQGFGPGDVGKPKAECLTLRLREAFPHAQIDFSASNLFELADKKEIFTGCDMLVGCVDDDLPRHVLSILASRYLVPLFDCSSLVERQENGWDFLSRMYTFIPGNTPCPACTRKVALHNMQVIAEAYSNPLTKKERQFAGYVKDSDIRAPSVYPLNMRSVSDALMEILNFISPSAPLSTSILHSWRKGRVHQSCSSEEVPDPFCEICASEAGLGGSRAIPLPMPPDKAKQTEDAMCAAIEEHHRKRKALRKNGTG